MYATKMGLPSSIIPVLVIYRLPPRHFVHTSAANADVSANVKVNDETVNGKVNVNIPTADAETEIGNRDAFM